MDEAKVGRARARVAGKRVAGAHAPSRADSGSSGISMAMPLTNLNVWCSCTLPLGWRLLRHPGRLGTTALRGLMRRAELCAADLLSPQPNRPPTRLRSSPASSVARAGHRRRPHTAAGCRWGVAGRIGAGAGQPDDTRAQRWRVDAHSPHVPPRARRRSSGLAGRRWPWLGANAVHLAHVRVVPIDLLSVRRLVGLVLPQGGQPHEAACNGSATKRIAKNSR